MCIMTPDTDSGKSGVSDFVPRPATSSKPSQAGQEIAMLLSLQKREWQELRSVSGIVFKYINSQEPISGRKVLLILVGSQSDDVTGIDATLDVAINGVSVDDLVAEIARGGSGIVATPEKPQEAENVAENRGNK